MPSPDFVREFVARSAGTGTPPAANLRAHRSWNPIHCLHVSFSSFRLFVNSRSINPVARGV
jgi:hypothetical protein